MIPIQYLVVQAKAPSFEYKGSPKNLFDFCDALFDKANKTFGTLYQINVKLKNIQFLSPDAELSLRFTSEADMIKFLRNFTIISRENGKYFIHPKVKKNIDKSS